VNLLPLWGILDQFHWLINVAGVLLLLVALGYTGAPFWAWTIGSAALLWGFAAPLWLWIVFTIIALIFNITFLRRRLVSAPMMNALPALGLLPTISETERIALEAGTTWVEGEFFTGKPDFKRILSEPYPDLTEKERAFLNGPVEEVCRMVDDWKVHQRQDLSAEVWAYLKEKRFFGMLIPEEYGGHGFSANGMNAVIAKLGSRSIPLAVDVMVPNSLGPAELLINYGTDEQRQRYLPGLATGEEIPCFALTEPDAGSDAASINSSGEVFKGEDGDLYMRLNWNKRYITLAAVATVHGLAFRLSDPDNLLGKGEEPGITVALIPTDVEGVVIGRRHDPLNTPFINSPTEGHDVVVSVDQIIGGPEQAGNGWRMLMETLAAGRGIFLPALSTGGGKFASRYVGAYSVVRQQFGYPIGRFEGIEELLAPIGGLTYLLEALSRYTCGGLDKGAKPAVVSAIVKYHSSEFNREIVNKAMDILGGKGIILGPRNPMGFGYMSMPISITVEGSNIVTRSLIMFGQGLVRCHPFALQEIEALDTNDLRAFDRAVWSHLRMMVRNFFRSGLLNLTRGYLARTPVSGPTANYYRKLSWASATFALMSDLALFSLGGGLKAKEKISGRFADILSWLYLASCALRRFEAEGRQEDHLPFVRWTVEHALVRIQQSFEEIYANFPVPWLRLLLRPVAWWARVNALGTKPDDRVGAQIAGTLQQPGGPRDALTAGIFLPEDEKEPLGQLEQAFNLAIQSQPVYERIREAIRSGKLPKDNPTRLVDAAYEAGVINNEEHDLLQRTEQAREEAVRVDDFSLEEMPVNTVPAGAERASP